MNLSMYYNVVEGDGFIKCDCLQMGYCVGSVLCGMLRVSDFVKGMQCNIAHLRMDICRKLATDSMNVVLCIGLLYSLLSTRPFNW